MTPPPPAASASPAPRSDEELEERLSRPSPQAIEALRGVPGDILVVGAGGKMGPSLTAMLQRAVHALGDGRRVLAVSRWGNAAQAARLDALGVERLTADLLADGAAEGLPRVPNVFYLAGQKFGTRDAPALTWMTNTVLPARVVSRLRDARFVAFSTGNVYPLTPREGTGSREDDTLAPIGEYAASCVGRERVFEDAAARWGTRSVLVRLNYAVDLRYGVLVDLAQRLLAGTPIPLAMGAVNCIWQGDANDLAVRALAHAAAPPLALNVTGGERLAVRALAQALGERLGREPRFEGSEGDDALLSDTARAQALFGPPAVDADTLLAWVAAWIGGGGATLGRATHFERRDGRF